MEGFAESESKRYVVGPMVELRLPHGFAVEADALYSRFGYRSSGWTPFFNYDVRVRGNVWEYPIVAKYRRGAPYVLAGYSPRRISTDFNSPGPDQFRTTHGLVTGGGIEVGRGRVRFSPEARYTRWNADAIGVYGSHGYYVAGAQNEVKVLLGFAVR